MERPETIIKRSLKNAELKRKITFILKTDGNPEAKKIKTEVTASINRINREVEKKLNAISDVLNLHPVSISLERSNPTWPEYSDSLIEIFSSLGLCDDLRLVLQFETHEEKDFISAFEENSLSHLVVIRFNVSSGKPLFTDSGLPITNVDSNNLNKITNIIEDVLLDISMYHTLVTPQLANIDLNSRRDFSFQKVKEVAISKLTSQIWDINKNKTYVALAGYFRKNTDFGYAKYVECWLNIINNVTIVPPPILDQIIRHKRHKQLPIKRILSITKGLSKGNYLLLRTEQKPLRIAVRKSLLGIFKKKRFNVGMVAICDASKYSEYIKYSQWVSIFKINL